MSKRAKTPRPAAAKKPRKEVKRRKEEKPLKETEHEREEKVEKPEAPAREEVRRPQVPAPNPLVSGRHLGDMVERRGRGFSMGELKGAALPHRLATSWSLPLDIRRRSVIDGNVQALKKWLVPTHKTAARQEPPTEPTAAAQKKSKPRRKKAGS